MQFPSYIQVVKRILTADSVLLIDRRYLSMKQVEKK